MGTASVNNYSTASFEVDDPLFPYLCFGSAYRTVNEDTSFWFQSFKYDGISNSLGKRDYYGSETVEEISWDVKRTLDRGYIIAGIAKQGEIAQEMVVKIDNDQNDDWKFFYSHGLQSDVKYCGVFPLADRTYLVVSTIDLSDPKNDEISLLKIDGSGGELWRKTYGSNGFDSGMNVVELSDGSILLVGSIGIDINTTSQSKMCLLKINREGDLIPLN